MASRRLLTSLLLSVALAAGAGCSETPPKPLPPGSGCTQNSECASGLCEAGACVDPNNPPDGGTGNPDGGGDQPPACLQPGTECEPGATPGCCTGLCFSRNGAKPSCGDKPLCEVFGGDCETADDCCSRTCLSTKKCGEQCKAVGTACTSGSDCCTGMCNVTCQQVPGTTPGKKTLGEPCSLSSECASNNCQAGFCAAISWCRASGDVCASDLDCCSGDCSATGATPGVCIKPASSGTGGCIQGGEPCATNDTCCSHLCLDLGTGAKACVLASGCRQTGENCTATSDCCGATILNSPGECRVSTGSTIGYCSKAGGNEEIGGCCNPGTTTGSSCRNYNSCEGQVSPMQTCHQDLTGAWRCFGGGGPGGVDPTKCPIGYDGANPECCIAPGASCWFRDQCCNFAPCLSDGVGGFKCTAQACVPAGNTCDPAATDPSLQCCNGLRCAPSGEVGAYLCRTAVTTTPDGGTPGGSDGGTSGGSDGGTSGGTDAGPVCKSNGTGCGAAEECCSGTCLSGATRVCGTCKVDSTSEKPVSCGANGDCCSGVCLNGLCRAPVTCVNQGGVCTGTSECCSGMSCIIPAGQLNGTCEQAATCSGPGQGCSTGQACCTGLRCMNMTGTLCSGSDSQCTCKFGIN